MAASTPLVTQLNDWRERAAASGVRGERDVQDFLAHVASKLRDKKAPLEAAALLRVEELALAWAAASGHSEAVTRFEQYAFEEVDRVARTARPPLEPAELRQLTRLRLLCVQDGQSPRLLSYGGLGPLRRWVRMVALRLVLDRAARAEPLDPNGTWSNLPDLARSPEQTLGSAMDHQAFKGAFEAALETLTARQRHLLRLSVLAGLSAAEIGQIYNAHRVTVARWLSEAREQLRRRILQNLDGAPGRWLQPGMDALALIDSQLDLSLERCLGTEEPPLEKGRYSSD